MQVICCRTFLYMLCFFKFVFIPGATETVYVRNIALNKDGSVANETYVPRCEKDRRIKLDSYEYLNRTCYPGSMCLTGYTVQLSLLAKYHLHESCSMKKVCHNLSFPAIEIEVGGYNTVFVRYQCIKTSSFLDMCTNTMKTTDSPVHLISSSRATFYKDCECQIKGLESIVLNDVRLKSRNEEKCSPSKLLIKFDRYSCNGSAEDYGSVFKQQLKQSSSATVLFAVESRSVEPEIVWLILQPKDSMTISCTPNKPLETTTTDSASRAPLMVHLEEPGDSKLSLPPSSKDNTNTAGLSAGLFVFAGAVLIAAILFVLVIYRRKKRIRERSESAQTNKNTEETLLPDHEVRLSEMNATKDECCSTDNVYAKAEINVYNQINDRRLNRNTSDINEEPYDTASLHKNVTVHNPTYDRLAGKEDKPSSFLRKVLRVTPIYSFAKE